MIIQHVEWEHSGIIGSYLRELGVATETVRLDRDEPIPFQGVKDGLYSAIVALGSPSTSYRPETNSRHNEELELFRTIRKKRVPSFNICYSMQMFCEANGGEVLPNPKGKEVGFFEVYPTPAGRGDAVFGGLGSSFLTLEWHGDRVSRLPRGAVHLASSRKTKYQVAVLDGIHYLVQGDGQAATEGMLESWLENDGEWAMGGTGVDGQSLLKEALENQVYLNNTYRRIFGNFLAIVVSYRKGARGREIPVIRGHTPRG